MEFVDEECVSRPSRLLLQSKPSSPPPYSLYIPTLFVSLASSFGILILVFFYFNSSEPFKSLLIWISISLLLGPFAPPSLTAGDIRVGIGPPLSHKETQTPNILHHEKPTRKSAKKSLPYNTPVEAQHIQSSKLSGSLVNSTQSEHKSEQIEWNETHDELLKRLMAKHPVGKPGRWEDIAKGFNGKFKVDIVIEKAKTMGEKIPSDEDSYNKFLRQRKPVDKRVLEQGTDAVETQSNQDIEDTNIDKQWCSTEDLALLNALKAFPKDAPLRWERITESVPGKTKSACLKRVSELKKNFRSLKDSSSQA